VLPSPPSASREFQRGDTIDRVRGDLRQPRRRDRATASSSPPTVLSDEGKTVFSTTDERRSDELKDSKTGGGYGHTGEDPARPRSRRAVTYCMLDARPTIGNSASISREVEFTVR
jgi:hypothetical protein